MEQKIEKDSEEEKKCEKITAKDVAKRYPDFDIKSWSDNLDGPVCSFNGTGNDVWTKEYNALTDTYIFKNVTKDETWTLQGTAVRKCENYEDILSDEPHYCSDCKYFMADSRIAFNKETKKFIDISCYSCFHPDRSYESRHIIDEVDLMNSGFVCERRKDCPKSLTVSVKLPMSNNVWLHYSGWSYPGNNPAQTQMHNTIDLASGAVLSTGNISANIGWLFPNNKNTEIVDT